MRSCDSCTACCKIMKIRELNKPDNTWCQHCKIGVGCGNYDARPESCRVFECVWLQTQRGGKPLALDLRPDKSRVVIGTANQGNEIVLHVDSDRPDAWKRGGIGKLVGEMLADGITVMVKCGDELKKL